MRGRHLLWFRRSEGKRVRMRHILIMRYSAFLLRCTVLGDYDALLLLAPLMMTELFWPLLARVFRLWCFACI